MYGFGWLSYFAKEEKPVCDNAAGLNLGSLKEYIRKKAICNATLVDIGKYRLALHLEEDVEQRIKDKDINYEEMQRNFYIAYKVNEFLDRPETYANMTDPPTSIFVGGDMQKLTQESKELGLEIHLDKEMQTLFRAFEKMLRSVTLPIALPEQVKKYYLSGYYTSYSIFHPIIKDLYEQCQKKLELQKNKKKTVSSK